MSKLLAALTATGGATAAAVGGTYLMQKGSESGAGDKIIPSPPATPVAPSSTDISTAASTNSWEFEDLTKFKDGHGGKCAASVFADNNIDFNATVNNVTPVDSSFFGTAPSQDTSDSTKGCLSINWLKDTVTSSTNKWKGTFTWIWSFVNGDKGFITFNVAKTSATGNQLDLAGGAYLLEKETTGGTSSWKVKWKQEVDSNGQKQVDNTNFDSKFPKAKSGTAIQINNKDYGGFIDDSSKLAEIAGDVTGGTHSFENKKGSWTLKKESTNKVGEWGHDLEWGKYIYGDSVFDLKTKLDSFMGEWSSDDAQPNSGT